ncbi:hypothetical protein [Pontibacter chitinilyticus]|uniref:hypothetical protein n=1 Tax=Pontibacter chitinilyticus TaxID=2674989 RepID=UPI00321A053E
MERNTSKKNAIILALIILTLLFGSMFLAIIAFQDIPKYNRPYLFAAAISAIGILIGYLLWKKIKPVILRYSLQSYDEGAIGFAVIMTVIGTLLFVVNELNTSSAYKTSCSSFFIINKYRQESGFRRPEVNTLVVNDGNKHETIVCDQNLWLNKKLGDKISLCFYESFLGFDYIEINEGN